MGQGGERCPDQVELNGGSLNFESGPTDPEQRQVVWTGEWRPTSCTVAIYIPNQLYIMHIMGLTCG